MVRMFAYVTDRARSCDRAGAGRGDGPNACPNACANAGRDPAPTATPAITPAQAAQVLDVLNDPSKRAAFADTLQAIVKGLPAPQAAAKPSVAAPATGLPIRLAPNSIGARVLMGGSSFLRHAADQALLAVAAVGNLPGWATGSPHCSPYRQPGQAARRGVAYRAGGDMRPRSGTGDQPGPAKASGGAGGICAGAAGIGGAWTATTGRHPDTGVAVAGPAGAVGARAGAGTVLSSPAICWRSACWRRAVGAIGGAGGDRCLCALRRHSRYTD